MGWTTLLKKTGRFLTYPIRHPATALREGGSAVKTGVVGAGIGYVGWQTLINDKPVARTVSDMAIGSDNVDKVTGAVGSVVDGVSSVTTKAGEAISGVTDAMNGVNGAMDSMNGAVSQQTGPMAGMGNFMQSLMSGNGLNMVGDFFRSIGEGKVSGMSLAGLIGSAFLIFGRFGWFGKIAGALLGMMILGNNVNMGRVMGAGAPVVDGTQGIAENGTPAVSHRRR